MIRLEVLGRLTKDVETIIGKDGRAIAKFTLAVNEGKDRTSFHDFTAFGRVAEVLTDHVKKGQMIFVNEGYIKNDVYEKEGKKVYSKNLICNSFKFC